jgi:hypothetical protein
MIVDLAVVHDPNGAVFVCNRLVTMRYVDDTQAAHCQTHVSIQVESFVVRPAMHDLPIHSL